MVVRKPKLTYQTPGSTGGNLRYYGNVYRRSLLELKQRVTESLAATLTLRASIYCLPGSLEDRIRNQNPPQKIQKYVFRDPRRSAFLPYPSSPSESVAEPHAKTAD